MPWSYSQIVNAFSERPEWVKQLKESLHGIERECLRVTAEGQLARTPHPRGLGAALTHPSITTDFSESQLELVTPTFATESEALSYLHKLHQVVHHHLPDEYLWPSSAPCPLPSQQRIPVANYGDSELGQYKHTYRQGLIHRYGAKMQTLSGIHYNFSFHKGVFENLRNVFRPEANEAQWVSKIYLKIARNFLRMGWLNSYLFGSTPVVHETFFEQVPGDLQTLPDGSYYHEYATSLRMSDRGYFGKVQQQVAISINSLDEYIADLRRAVNTPHPDYAALKEPDGSPARQLNTHLLQDIAEYYARIRPKSLREEHSHPLDSFVRHGVAYLELRSVDITPFHCDGLILSQLLFLHTFVIYCLFKESPPIGKEEHRWITENQNTMALRGRDPQVMLCQGGGLVRFRDWAKEILDEMRPIAEFLDQASSSTIYVNSLERQLKKWREPEETASARVLRSLQIEGVSFREWGMELARQYKARFVSETLSGEDLKAFAKLAETSHRQQAALESGTTAPSS